MDLHLPDARVHWHRHWLAAPEADALQRQLREDVPWEVHRIRMFGNWVDSPRLSCWIGDPQARYRYSGAEFVPHPWPPRLSALRERLQVEGIGRFNSVLLNRYRGGADYMTFMTGAGNSCVGMRRYGPSQGAGSQWILYGVSCAPRGRTMTDAQIDGFLTAASYRGS